MTSFTDIDHFLADRTVQSVIEASREMRPLRICYPNEVPVSRFLSWLLDPSQGHGLNGGVLRSLLIACWNNLSDAQVSIATRNRITPSKLFSESFADALVQREVKLDNGQRSLDVLVLLPEQKLLIAIENKFGAAQGDGQLQTYRKSLAKQFKDYQQVLVFLDLYSRAPADDHWIGLDYSWLVEELKVAETSAWLGEVPRRTLREFLHAIDLNSEDTYLPGVKESQLFEMVRNHSAVFEQMAKWKNDAKSTTDLMLALYGGRVTKNSSALRNLFPVYCQRIDLWHQCIPMLAYAELRARAAKQFQDKLDCHPKRSAFYFALDNWHQFGAEDGEYWPIQVMVREQLNPKVATQKFVIMSFIRFDSVAESCEESLMEIVTKARTKNLKRKHKITDGQKSITLKVDFASDRATAGSKLLSHLLEMENELSKIPPP